MAIKQDIFAWLQQGADFTLTFPPRCVKRGALDWIDEDMATKKGHIKIDQFFCKECHYCLSVCKNEQIIPGKDYNEKGYRPVLFVGDGRCNACGLCAIVCPDAAIEVFCE